MKSQLSCRCERNARAKRMGVRAYGLFIDRFPLSSDTHDEWEREYVKTGFQLERDGY